MVPAMATRVSRAAARPRAAAGLLFLLLPPLAGPAPGEAAGPAAGIDCRCRANGRSYGLGERACIGTPEGPRLAECRMVQNVTSWATLGPEGCAVSRFGPPAGPAAALAAATAAVAPGG